MKAVLQFAPPIEYNKQFGEEFMQSLLDRVPEELATCSGFKHTPKASEVTVELAPKTGATRSKSGPLPELLSKATKAKQ